jgi:hypothetical protein
MLLRQEAVKLVAFMVLKQPDTNTLQNIRFVGNGGIRHSASFFYPLPDVQSFCSFFFTANFNPVQMSQPLAGGAS